MEPERLRAWTYARQRLGGAAPDASSALDAVVATYSSHPSASLTLLARTRGLTAEAFRSLDVLRLPAMRGSIHLLPRALGPTAFAALRETRADRDRRLRGFGLDEAAFLALRDRVLHETTPEPLTQAQLSERLGEDATRVKGVTAQMTRDGVLQRIGAERLRSNALRYAPLELDGIPKADDALATLLEHYIRAFGPVRPADAMWWTGAPQGRVRPALRELDLADVGDGHLLAASDFAAWHAGVQEPPPDAVDLLPKWDALTMAYPPGARGRLFASDEDAARGYDHRGDGLPLVLVGGVAAGTWTLTKDGSTQTEWFGAPPAAAVLEALAQRAAEVRTLLA